MESFKLATISHRVILEISKDNVFFSFGMKGTYYYVLVILGLILLLAGALNLIVNGFQVLNIVISCPMLIAGVFMFLIPLTKKNIDVFFIEKDIVIFNELFGVQFLKKRISGINPDNLIIESGVMYSENAAMGGRETLVYENMGEKENILALSVTEKEGVVTCEWLKSVFVDAFRNGSFDSKYLPSIEKY